MTTSVAPEFACIRVSNGVVINVFDSREDALALLKKHARHKKANLYVLDTSTNEPVVFSEEEWNS